MDFAAILNLPFVQIALPICVTFILTVAVAAFVQNKRIDDLRGDMVRGFEGVNKRLDRLEMKLESHTERITRLEERTSPLAHR